MNGYIHLKSKRNGTWQAFAAVFIQESGRQNYVTDLNGKG